jgi:hypothetical protein
VKKIEAGDVSPNSLKRRTQRIEANFFLLNQTSRPTVGQAGPDWPGFFSYSWPKLPEAKRCNKETNKNRKVQNDIPLD